MIVSLNDYKKMNKKNKYKNKKCEWNGLKFDSDGELKHYKHLLILQAAGEISDLRRQIKFVLIPAFKKERATIYICDFIYKLKDGTLIADEYKSKPTRTQSYIIKRKLFKIKYPEYKFIESGMK